MAANTSPIYSRLADIQWQATLVTAANNVYDGTGTVQTIFTSDVTNGGRVERLRIRAAGTNAATVLRLFINNGSTNTTAANNVLYEEITLPATTISQTAALLNQEITLGISLPAGYKLNVVLGTAATPGFYVSVIGGKY